MGISFYDQVMQKVGFLYSFFYFLLIIRKFKTRLFREFQATLEFRPIRDTDGVEDHQITVCVRKRPLNKKELARKEVDVITVPSKDRLIVHEPKQKVGYKYHFVFLVFD